MTVIEFFSGDDLKNIAGALLGETDKILFLGKDMARMRSRIEIYHRVLQARGQDVAMEAVQLNTSRIQVAVRILTQLAEQEKTCIFSLDGGNEIGLAAAGIVYARNPERVKLCRYNAENGMLYDCVAESGYKMRSGIRVSVEENILLHGGVIARDSNYFEWDYTKEFKEDVRAMWNVLRRDTKAWNNMTQQFAASLSGSDVSSTLRFRYDEGETARRIRRNLPELWQFLLEMGRLGLLRDLSEDPENRVLTGACKNRQILQCLTKPGVLLELYTAIVAMELKQENGEPFYSDVMVGVNIDWDGVRRKYREQETENEIDVILMKGAVPVFISCKNGLVEKDEPYKLDTVAKRFGSDYERKALVSTNLHTQRNAESLVTRMSEMGIRSIDHADTLPEEAFAAELRALGE